MNTSIIADLEQRLKKRLDPAQEWSITNLNDLPPDVIADARFLDKTAGSVLRTALLWFYIPASEHGYLPSFVDDVVNGGADPATWERGGTLFLVASQTRQLLVRSVSELLSPLRSATGNDSPEWLRIDPDRLRWEAGDAAPGSPAVAPPALDYHWHTLFGVARTIDPSHRSQPVTEDIEVITRRWIASRLAWEIGKAQLSLGDRDVDTLVRELLPGHTTAVSDDARIAIDALMREEKEYNAIPPDTIPGFQGPQEWFLSPNEKRLKR